MTALLFAARDGQFDALRELVAGGANVNEVTMSDKTSPLVMAIINGHLDLAKYLLEGRARTSLLPRDSRPYTQLSTFSGLLMPGSLSRTQRRRRSLTST